MKKDKLVLSPYVFYLIFVPQGNINAYNKPLLSAEKSYKETAKLNMKPAADRFVNLAVSEKNYMFHVDKSVNINTDHRYSDEYNII